jgi:hypothetical protein
MLDSWATGDIWAPVEVVGEDDESEPMGSKEKFWTSSPDGERWLFKYARVHEHVTRGEDWAECLVHSLASQLRIPTATVRLAHCRGRRGIVSRSMVTQTQVLVHGNELLSMTDADYDREAERENPRYTVSTIESALRIIDPTPGLSGLVPVQTAFDQLAGYLMLDAWVAGRDRHHRNWAVVTDGERLWLAPSFDHGNALGFQESSMHHDQLASDETALLRWSRRGKSPHFFGRPSLTSIANQALDTATPEAAQAWRERLSQVTQEVIEQALYGAPEAVLSAETRRFCVRLLLLNRRRVLDGD